jgi:hypothetical protein
VTEPDPRIVRRDDRLLDRVGRGAPADGDEAEAMLAAWRQTLPAPGPPGAALLAAVTAPPARPKRRVARASLGIAASVALVTGGITVAAAYAGPRSPLWPVTRFVYSGVAESRLALDSADQAVSDARTAARQHRFPEAARLLATADQLADKVTEPEPEHQLRTDIAGVRDLLPAAEKPAVTPHVPDPEESLGVDPPPIGDEDDGPHGASAPEHDGDHPRPGRNDHNGARDGAHDGDHDGDHDEHAAPGPDEKDLPHNGKQRKLHPALPAPPAVVVEPPH